MHKYAKEMMAMAEAAKTSERPWEILQWQLDKDGTWFTCGMCPFDEQMNIIYDRTIRIKPKEKKKLWLWQIVIDGEVHRSVYWENGEEISPDKSIWHKTNTFIEIEGE